MGNTGGIAYLRPSCLGATNYRVSVNRDGNGKGIFDGVRTFAHELGHK